MRAAMVFRGFDVSGGVKRMRRHGKGQERQGE